jgi:2'-5' RNA ligase
MLNSSQLQSDPGFFADDHFGQVPTVKHCVLRSLISCRLGPAEGAACNYIIEFGETMSEKATTARVFFALWPNTEVQSALDRAAHKLHAMCGGRQTRRDTIHITLVFLGETELVRLKALRTAAGNVRAPAFSWKLGKFGWWHHNRIAWAAPETTPAALMQLLGQLQGGLREAGFQFDERPYLAHATLLRKADCRNAALSAEPIPWEVNDFVLVRSALGSEGSAYEIIGRWPLLHVPS